MTETTARERIACCECGAPSGRFEPDGPWIATAFRCKACQAGHDARWAEHLRKATVGMDVAEAAEYRQGENDWRAERRRKARMRCKVCGESPASDPRNDVRWYGTADGELPYGWYCTGCRPLGADRLADTRCANCGIYIVCSTDSGIPGDSRKVCDAACAQELRERWLEAVAPGGNEE